MGLGFQNLGISEISDLIVAGSYLVIAAYLLYLCHKKRDHLPYPLTMASLIMILVLRAGVIAGRVFEIWKNEFSNICVSAASIFFAIYSASTISHLVLYFVKFKLPGEYKKLVNELQNELKIERLLSEDIERLMDLLDTRIARVENHLKHKGWVDETNLELDVLKEQLESLRVKHGNAIVCRNRPS